ncbi:hypothetical protein HKX48_004754 [Thoreauomyces humboldtii]|nr:hypothetical protein HKX48_004754 [Thoreauomyces humboldtii]
MAHAPISYRQEGDPFASNVGFGAMSRLPSIGYPDIKQANLGSFPTPARATAAGKSGTYSAPGGNAVAVTRQSIPPTSPFQPSTSNDHYITTLAASQDHQLQHLTVPAQVQDVENKLRAHVYAHRIRVADLFTDFDHLRSTYVSATQFRRSIGAMLHKGVSSPLTEAEVELLLTHYDVRGNKMIKWTSFCDSINRVFGAKRLENTPTQQILDPKQVVKHLRPLSPTSATVLHQLIERLRTFVYCHGSDVKTWFNDFDKHNNGGSAGTDAASLFSTCDRRKSRFAGFITINQFRRGLPANLLSMKEQDLLIDQYSTDYSVNYFKLNTDVNRKSRRVRQPDATSIVGPASNPNYRTLYVPVGTEELIYPPRQQYDAMGPTEEEVEDKIKKHVYKDRIRVIEFFRDYDRHNNGLVTEAQFRAGLRVASIELKEPEINALLNVYQDGQGRVRYRQFSDSIEQVFTMKDLEKDPLLEVGPIPRELLVQGANSLQASDEARCTELLGRLQGLVTERHLLLEPFFKDFDMYLGQGVIGRVTRSHFHRLLSSMKLDLSDRDLHVLFSKFEYTESPDQINYGAFFRAIDPETYAAYASPNTGTRPRLPPPTSLTDDFLTARPPTHTAPQPPLAPSTPHITDLLSVLRTFTLQNRIRISEQFRDADKLRSYSIPRAEFIRGVHRIGVPGVSVAALDVIADAYEDPKKEGCCRWKRFEEDVEKGEFIQNQTAGYSMGPQERKQLIGVSGVSFFFSSVW